MRLSRECCGAPGEIRMVTMAEFHKNGSKQPFLWNCAAIAAGRNRKAVYTVDIIIMDFPEKSIFRKIVTPALGGKEGESGMRIESGKYGGPCLCGRDHTMDTRLCVIETGASENLEQYLAEAGLAGLRRCAVYDENTCALQQLRRPAAEQEIVLDPRGLHATEISTGEVLRRLRPDTQVLLAVGGGTIHDIVRYCAKDRGLPFVSLPTAASCDGFCSTAAAMTWGGYKSTMICEAPVLVAADLNVIAHAPAYLTASGVGDMLGKFVALADWRIAHLLTGEHFCRRIHDIMQDAARRIWDNCLATRQGDSAAFEAVTYGLLMSGLAMQMMGSSRPASGGEHHISHLIETEPRRLGIHSDALHGEKVGVGTILASNEYHRLTACEHIRGHVLPYAQVDMDWLRNYFGEKLWPAACSENEHDCLDQVTPERIQVCWPEIREIVSSIPEGETVRRRLRDLGAKQSLADLGVPEEKLPELLRVSPLIRNRLTLMRIRRMLDL